MSSRKDFLPKLLLKKTPRANLVAFDEKLCPLVFRDFTVSRLSGEGILRESTKIGNSNSLESRDKHWKFLINLRKGEDFPPWNCLQRDIPWLHCDIHPRWMIYQWNSTILVAFHRKMSLNETALSFTLETSTMNRNFRPFIVSCRWIPGRVHSNTAEASVNVFPEIKPESLFPSQQAVSMNNWSSHGRSEAVRRSRTEHYVGMQSMCCQSVRIIRALVEWISNSNSLNCEQMNEW